MPHPNRLKWLTPPTIQQIEAVYKKRLKVSAANFELFYRMPKGMIAKVRYGSRDMPAKYWHLFFEEPNTFNAPKIEQPPPRKQKRTIQSLSHIM